jgi:nucleotide-binding universal stress UspA family protein
MRYGVTLDAKVVRARSAGEAIVAEAETGTAELVVLGAGRVRPHNARFFGETTSYVLKNAPCRVVVAIRPRFE